MKFFNINRENKSARWIMNTAMCSAYLWLFIVFVLRRVFVYFHFNSFMLGILPSFFAGLSIYLSLYLKFKSRLTSALVTFALLSLTEILQLFTPRTFDPLDFLASLLGIGCADLMRAFIENKFKNQH